MADAPDFTLPDQAGRDWRLADHRDAATLLVFYRGDWWPYCNGQLVSLAKQHGRITAAGARVAGISVDGMGRNAAMVEKLALPFPLLSDPDGTRAIQPYGAWHEGNDMARPAVVVTTPSGGEAVHQVGEDFADRPDEDELVAAIDQLDVGPVEQPIPAKGHPEPGDNAVNPRSLTPYFSGAKMAVTALSGRVHEAREDADRMVAEYDRFLDALGWLKEQRG